MNRAGAPRQLALLLGPLVAAVVAYQVGRRGPVGGQSGFEPPRGSVLGAGTRSVEERVPGGSRREKEASPWPAVVVAGLDTDVTMPFEAGLVSMRVSRGERVEAGAVLFELDARDIDASIASKRAEFAALRAELARERVELRAAQRSLAREQSLTGITAKVALEEAERARDVAQATVRARQSELEKIGWDLERLKVARSEASVVAPHAGVVSEIYRRRGDRVGAGARVVRVVGGGRRVRFAMDVQGSARIAVGDDLFVSFGQSETSYEIRVVAVAEAVDPASRLVFGDAVFLAGGESVTVGTAGTVAKVRPQQATDGEAAAGEAANQEARFLRPGSRAQRSHASRGGGGGVQTR